MMGDAKAIGRLGFKDIEAFIKTMLSKQIWKMILTPNCLISQILKCRYFHRRNIFDAKLGYNSNFLWRSLFSSIKLFE